MKRNGLTATFLDNASLHEKSDVVVGGVSLAIFDLRRYYFL